MDGKFWAASVGDNRLSGVLSELWEAIDACDDPDRLHTLHRRLTLGIVNHAKEREAVLRENKKAQQHAKMRFGRQSPRRP